MSGRSNDFPYVCRDGIAQLELNQVTWDDLSSRYDNCIAAADDGSRGRAETAQRIHRLLGVVLLVEAHDDVQEDDCGDDATFDPRLNGEAHGKGEDQHLHRPKSERRIESRCVYGSLNKHHGVGDLAQQYLQGLHTGAIVQLVWTVRIQPGSCISRREAVPSVGPQFCDDMVGRETVSTWDGHFAVAVAVAIILPLAFHIQIRMLSLGRSLSGRSRALLFDLRMCRAEQVIVRVL